MNCMYPAVYNCVYISLAVNSLWVGKTRSIPAEVASCSWPTNKTTFNFIKNLSLVILKFTYIQGLQQRCLTHAVRMHTRIIRTIQNG